MNPPQHGVRRRLADLATGAVALAALLVSMLAGQRLYSQWASQREEARRHAPQPIANWPQLLTMGHLSTSGDDSARIVEFGDFQCPFCARWAGTLDSLRRAWRRPLPVRFINYPLTAIHPQAFAAAIAGECGARQGRFPEMARVLYAHQSLLGQTPWTTLAKFSGLPDIDEFSKCLTDSTVAARIRSDAELAANLHLLGTPTFAIDGVVYPAGTPETVLFDALKAK